MDTIARVLRDGRILTPVVGEPTQRAAGGVLGRILYESGWAEATKRCSAGSDAALRGRGEDIKPRTKQRVFRDRYRGDSEVRRNA